MMKIREFAVFCGTTAKTLRFYDRKGLLPADYVSPVNGYRYYRAETAAIFHKIETLKQAGFTLAEIGEKLACGDENWMIESLEALIQRHREKIVLCEKLKAEYAAKAAMICGAVTPSIEVHIENNCLVMAQGERSASAVYRSREAAELCAKVVSAGSRSDVFICFDYDEVEKLLAGRCVAEAFTALLPCSRIEDLDEDILHRVTGGAQNYLCFIGFNPDIENEVGVQLLTDISKLFGANGECAFAADIDVRYSNTVINVVAIQ